VKHGNASSDDDVNC